MKNKKHYTELIKNEAKRLGFISCGISRAEFLEDEAPRLEKWLKMKMNGEMKYMENVPPKVSITEGVEIAKKYSTAESGSFVNGMLDSFYQTLEKV